MSSLLIWLWSTKKSYIVPLKEVWLCSSFVKTLLCYLNKRYAFQIESKLYRCLNFKEPLVRNRCDIWSLSDWNGTRKFENFGFIYIKVNLITIITTVNTKVFFAAPVPLIIQSVDPSSYSKSYFFEYQYEMESCYWHQNYSSFSKVITKTPHNFSIKCFFLIFVGKLTFHCIF